MRTRVIYDPGEPVVLRSYALEALAILDQAVLEAGDIPSMIRYDRAGEGVNATIPFVMWKDTPYEHLMLPVQ